MVKVVPTSRRVHSSLQNSPSENRSVCRTATYKARVLFLSSLLMSCAMGPSFPL